MKTIFATVAQVRDVCVDAIERRPFWLRLAALVGLVFGAIVLLLFLNWLLNRGLWGEVFFAVTVVTLLVFVLARLVGKLITWFELGESPDRPALLFAFAASVFTVLGLPIALFRGVLGSTVLFGSTSIFYGAALLYSRRRPQAALSRAWLRFSLVMFLSIGTVVGFAYAAGPAEDRMPPPAAASTPVDVKLYELAHMFRPFLFFDSGERYVPLDIERAMALGKVNACTNKIVFRSRCPEVRSPTKLTEQQFDYVILKEEGLEPGVVADAKDTAYYFHISENKEVRELYIDYWWYYAQNPSPVAADVLCGPAMRWLWVACGDHPADWEGLVVVLAECTTDRDECVTAGSRRFRPVRVRYAQHEGVFPFEWGQLQAWWNDPQTLGRISEEARELHPLAFVAQRSHASYARLCRAYCPQTTRPLPERRDGGQPWVNNDETHCAGVCLKPLRVNSRGEPTGWNRFGGRWGRQVCILAGAFCDRYKAPRGPAFQKRYRDPADATDA